jgi:hypothetical protein
MGAEVEVVPSTLTAKTVVLAVDLEPKTEIQVTAILHQLALLRVMMVEMEILQVEPMLAAEVEVLHQLEQMVLAEEMEVMVRLIP